MTVKQQLLQPVAERRDDTAILVDIMDACGLLPEVPQYLYEIAEKGVAAGDRLAILEPAQKYVAEIHREDCLLPVLYKTMGKALGSMAKAVFWANFIFGELDMANAMRVGYQFPHVHPELENDPDMAPVVIRDQVFGAVDASPSGTVIAGARGTLESAMEDLITFPDKKIHVYDELVNEYLQDITPEKEAEKLTNPDYPYLISAGMHSEEGVNTVMRNPDTYRFRQPYVLRMNPKDAREQGLADGQWVRVTSRAGSIKIPIEYNQYSTEGYGLISHHFGLYGNDGKAYGSAVNILTSCEDVDEITGDPTYRYVPCRIEALKEGESHDVWNYE